MIFFHKFLGDKLEILKKKTIQTTCTKYLFYFILG